MKYEWKKSEREIYLPKDTPALVDVPKAKYFTISGRGNPNDTEFSDKIGVLYSLSYAVRMMPKNGFTPNGYFEYTVYPLEGVWSGNLTDKSTFEYNIMIKQPDFVDESVFEKALEIANKKKPSPLLKEVGFEEIEDGLSVQILHIGSYDDEPTSFAKMDEFAIANNLKRQGKMHREIYLSDPSKTSQGKLKTVLRYTVVAPSE
jgi:hypothetical protein